MKNDKQIGISGEGVQQLRNFPTEEQPWKAIAGCRFGEVPANNAAIEHLPQLTTFPSNTTNPLPASIYQLPRLRVGILTLPLGENYGGILQSWALQEYINRNVPGVEAIGLDIQFMKSTYSTTKKIKELVNKTIKNKWYVDQYRNKPFQPLRDFINYQMFRTSKITTEEQLEEAIDKYDLDGIIVGSDQIWRPEYARDLKYNYFLDFALHHDIRRIAYSASFGKDTWQGTNEESSNIRGLINAFDYVSVREDSGKNIAVHNLEYHKDVPVTVDPVLLLPQEAYRHLCFEIPVEKQSKHLVTYFLDANSQKHHMAMWMKYELGLSIKATTLPKHPRDMTKKEITTQEFPSVEEWLANFRDADFVITDSFHGMMFCIIFQKNFMVVGNESRGLARFNNVLKRLCLEDRMVTKYDSIAMQKIANTPLDWSSIEEKLSKWVDFSKNYLQQALQ